MTESATMQKMNFQYISGSSSKLCANVLVDAPDYDDWQLVSYGF